MTKTLSVVRNEVLATFARRSFLFTAFGLPLVAILVFSGVSVLRHNSAGGSEVPHDPGEQPELNVEGYVDPGGLIKALHPDVPSRTGPARTRLRTLLRVARRHGVVELLKLQPQPRAARRAASSTGSSQ